MVYVCYSDVLVLIDEAQPLHCMYMTITECTNIILTVIQHKVVTCV